MIAPFRESHLWSTPLKDLHLAIEGTPLQALLADFDKGLREAGFAHLRPRYYLSLEWGVPFDTIAIAIPFYLARSELTAIQAEEVGFVEGNDRADILRYLRHEFGHVVNYAYKLYEREVWIAAFGSITQPYVDDYRPIPFNTRHVVHLPGWYAQKHPDEDWAETLAVWLTPGRDWAQEYASWPVALAKLECCDRLVREVRGQEPIVVATDLDEAVSETSHSLAHHYRSEPAPASDFPPGLDGALRAIFENKKGQEGEPRVPAARLIRRLERPIMANVYRWTGHFPERTRGLLRFLAGRAEALDQVYAPERENAAIIALTALVSSLAMNFVLRGTYLP